MPKAKAGISRKYVVVFALVGIVGLWLVYRYAKRKGIAESEAAAEYSPVPRQVYPSQPSLGNYLAGGFGNAVGGAPAGSFSNPTTTTTPAPTSTTGGGGGTGGGPGSNQQVYGGGGSSWVLGDAGFSPNVSSTLGLPSSTVIPAGGMVR